MNRKFLAVSTAKRFAHDSRQAALRLHADRHLPEHDNHRWNAVVNHGRERHSRPPP